MKLPSCLVHLTLRASLLLSILVLNAREGSAAPVYKGIDENGNVFYSTAQPKPGAKPAALPPIMRGEHKIPQKQLLTCRDHAGIDCNGGPDGDGSVICVDGFRDSAQRFTFSCSAAKLKVASVSPLNNHGSFTVVLRNERSIAAQGTVVSLKLPDGKEQILEGPKEVEPYGAVEYTYLPSSEIEPTQRAMSPLPHNFRPGEQHIKIICSNCP